MEVESLIQNTQQGKRNKGKKSKEKEIRGKKEKKKKQKKAGREGASPKVGGGLLVYRGLGCPGFPPSFYYLYTEGGAPRIVEQLT